MYKSTIVLATLALAGLGWQGQDNRPALVLKEETMTIEWVPAINEAVMIVQAEAEQALGQIEIRNPHGHPLFNLNAQGRNPIQGFLFETREADAGTVLARYAEGIYDIRGRTVDGQSVLGSAALSHALLPEPLITYPLEGTLGVPTTNLTVNWAPDPNASGYRVILEQDDNDGLVVELPAGTSSLDVPDNFLAPNTETLLEIGAIGLNGNCTLVEVSFTTQ